VISRWIQRGVALAVVVGLIATAAALVPPIGDGVDRVLKPARDLTGWLGDNLDARREQKQLRAHHDDLEREIVDLQLQAVDNAAFKKLVQLNQALDLERYEPVQARVEARAQQLVPARVRIDRGSGSGVQPGQPVLTGDGLVGRVTAVQSTSAIVTLINDSTFGPGALVSDRRVKATVLGPRTGDGNLELTLVNPAHIHRGDLVYTSGSDQEETPSFYPEGLPVGRVRTTGDGGLDARVKVEPLADLAEISRVEVLTSPG
jgi:rod shape-determining protein MreC